MNPRRDESSACESTWHRAGLVPEDGHFEEVGGDHKLASRS